MRVRAAYLSDSILSFWAGRNAVSVRGDPVRGGRRVSEIERAHVTVDARDNVTTLHDEGIGLDRLQGGLTVVPGIPFGHKAALRAISQGEPVIKYGVAIGRATRDIGTGEHVHVHNCV